MALSALFNWIEGLPVGWLYICLGAFAFAENVFPPLPADSVVAFGSFLAARGHGTALAAALSAWIANVMGAMAMYALGRYYGAERLERRMFGARAEQVGRRLDAYYGRYGLAALFLARFIPGVRALVPPFAGALRVPPLAAVLLIGGASAIWYGAVSYAGFTLGADWPATLRVLSEHAAEFAVVAVALAAALAAVWLLRRGRR